MTAALGPAVRRILALSLLAAALLALWQGIIAPLAAFHADRIARLERAQAMLVRHAALSGREAALRARLDERDPVAARLYHAAAPALASANLLRDITRAAMASGLTISGSRVMSVPPEEGLGRIGLAITAIGDTTALAGFLETLARSPRFLDVHKARIRAPALQLGEGRQQLAADFEILAFFEPTGGGKR